MVAGYVFDGIRKYGLSNVSVMVTQGLLRLNEGLVLLIRASRV